MSLGKLVITGSILTGVLSWNHFHCFLDKASDRILSADLRCLAKILTLNHRDSNTMCLINTIQFGQEDEVWLIISTTDILSQKTNTLQFNSCGDVIHRSAATVRA